MIRIEIEKGENLEKALKRFKRKFNQIGTIRELRDRQQFTKKSVTLRKQKNKAKYIQKLRDAEED